MGLGSGIRDPEKTYPGSRGQNGTGSRIRIRNTDKNPFKNDMEYSTFVSFVQR
jgi:hypothetical protein